MKQDLLCKNQHIMQLNEKISNDNQMLSVRSELITQMEQTKSQLTAQLEAISARLHLSEESLNQAHNMIKLNFLYP